MFDINTILSAALSAAITEATKPLLERIATLESANDILHKTQHEDMVAMRDRITALEDSDEFVTNRIARLEAAQPAAAPQPVGVDPKLLAEASLNYLNDQEWFWEKLHNTINDNVVSRVEEAMDSHCSDYDHDEYDSHIGDDDKHFDGDIEDAVRDAIGNLTFEVSVS